MQHAEPCIRQHSLLQIRKNVLKNYCWSPLYEAIEGVTEASHSEVILIERERNKAEWYWKVHLLYWLSEIYDLILSDIHSRSAISCHCDTNAIKFKAIWKDLHDYYRSKMTNALKSDNQL